MKALLAQPSVRRVVLVLVVLGMYATLVAVSADTFQTAPLDSVASDVSSQPGLWVWLRAGPYVDGRLTNIAVERIEYRHYGVEKPELNRLCMSALDFYDYDENMGMWTRDDFLWEIGMRGTSCHELEWSSSSAYDGEIFHSFRLEPELVSSVITHTLYVDRDSFWYPFDGFDKPFKVEGTYTLEQDGMNTTSQRVLLAGFYITDSSPWLATAQEGYIENLDLLLALIGSSDNWQHRVLELTYKRPLFDRVAFPVMTFILLALVILLCFVNSNATFVEGAAAVFFGTFGLTQILVPADLGTRTLVDVAVWGAYLAMGVLLVARLVSTVVEAFPKRESSVEPGPQPPPDPPPEPPAPPHPDNTKKTAAVLILGAIASLFTWLLWKARLRR